MDGGGDERSVFVIKEREKDSDGRRKMKEEDFSNTSRKPEWNASQMRFVVRQRNRQRDKWGGGCRRLKRRYQVVRGSHNLTLAVIYG